jgi:hypothetical protein
VKTKRKYTQSKGKPKIRMMTRDEIESRFSVYGGKYADIINKAAKLKKCEGFEIDPGPDGKPESIALALRSKFKRTHLIKQREGKVYVVRK